MKPPSREDGPKPPGTGLRWGLLAVALAILAIASATALGLRVINPHPVPAPSRHEPGAGSGTELDSAATRPSGDSGTAQHVPGSGVAEEGVARTSTSPTTGTARLAPASPADVSPGWAEPATPSAEVSMLRRALDGVIDGARWNGARWSILAVSLDRGDVLYAREPDLLLAPASNVKIVTTATALNYLGPDFRYTTYLLADGPVVDGVIQGDLVLYGTGDPALSDRFFRSESEIFERLTQRLGEQGIRAVAGNLVGDGSYFAGPSVEATWDPADVNEWFAAPVSGLSFNENMVALRVEAAPWVGAPPRIQTLPNGSGIPIENHARTVAAPPEAYRRLAVVRETHAQPIQVVGEIAAGSTEVWREMTVSDPPLYAATLFAKTLERQGIQIYGSIRSVHDPSESVLGSRVTWAPAFSASSVPRIVAEHRSPPLVELLEVVNNDSHNLFAEALFRTVGATVAGEASFQGGVVATRRFLSEVVGPAGSGVVQVDGSGLSAENRLSARVFVRLLERMETSEFAADFEATLPEAGNRRELPRMYRSSAAGNLRAKTGTIDRVSSLSGLVESASGERIAFSIIANGVPSTWRAKRLEDRIGIQLAEFRRP